MSEQRANGLSRVLRPHEGLPDENHRHAHLVEAGCMSLKNYSGEREEGHEGGGGDNGERNGNVKKNGEPRDLDRDGSKRSRANKVRTKDATIEAQSRA